MPTFAFPSAEGDTNLPHPERFLDDTLVYDCLYGATIGDGERARDGSLGAAPVREPEGMGILEQIEARLERIETRLAKCGPVYGDMGLVDQQHSDLGRRKHCAVVRRRIGEGEDGAFIVGKRHLLTPEAYREELERENAGKPLDGSSEEDAAYRQLMARIGK